MAELRVADGATIEMGNIDIRSMWQGPTDSRTSIGFTVDAGDHYLERYSGFGLQYDAAGMPVAGTITGLVETISGLQTYAITGANLAVGQINAWAATDDTHSALAALFPGHDTLIGGSGNDKFLSTSAGQYLYGGAGADRITGGVGSHIYGNSPSAVAGDPDGDDYIEVWNGLNYVQGNGGNDTIDGGQGADRLYGGAGDDQITGWTGNDWLQGNKGNDTLYGGLGDDTIHGGAGDDVIYGDLATEFIASQPTADNHSTDQLFGDIGNDTLYGGSWSDTMTGGAGADIFAFDDNEYALPDIAHRTPVIADFAHGEDHIKLSWVPTAIATGSPETSAQAAFDEAGRVFHTISQRGPVLVAVGSDTYMIFSDSVGPLQPDMIVRIVGHSPGDFDLTDFV